MSDILLCNVREDDDGQILVSYMTDDHSEQWGSFEPDFAVTLGYSLLFVTEPSLWRRLLGVWRTRKGV